MEIEEIKTASEPIEQKDEPHKIIPWLDKQLLEDRRVVMTTPNAESTIIDPSTGAPQAVPTISKENVMIDFKTFVLTANNRPIDFQVLQIMFAVKQLMDVCEKQQILIESLNSMLKQENPTKVMN